MKRSVSRTSGCEKSARPCEKERLFHQPRGTTSTITPITEFQSSGAVPMPTDELPVMESRSATVQPSGKGQLQTERSPTSDSDASSRPRRKNSTLRSPPPASICGESRPARKTGTSSPNPSFVMKRFTAPLPPRPAVK